MATITDLIDLTNPFRQCFFLPIPIIYYTFKSAKLTSSQKLMKSCKIFKILQLKFDVSEVKNLSIFQKSHIFDIESSCIKYGPCVYEPELGTSAILPALNIQVKALKVLNDLNLYHFHQSKFNYVIPKLDLSKLRRLWIRFDFQITPDLIKMLFPASLEFLDFYLQRQTYFNPVVVAFEKCLNIRDISVTYFEKNEVIAEKEFKKIVKIKRNSKIKFCIFQYVVNIDGDDVMKFMDNHVDGVFGLCFKEEHFENFLKLKNYFVTVAEERKQKERIPNACIYLSCGGNDCYSQKL